MFEKKLFLHSTIFSILFLLPIQAKGVPVISIAPFSDKASTPKERDHFLQGGLSAALAVKLSQVSLLQAEIPGRIDEEKPDFLVVGWYHRYGQDGVFLDLEAALVDLKTGDLLWSSTSSGEREELSSLVDKLVKDLLFALEIYLEQQTLSRLEARITKDSYAFVIFGRAVNALIGSSRAIDLSRATEQFRRAVLIDPDFAEARFYLGLQLVESESKRKAIELFKQSLSDRPGLLPAYHQLGNLYTQVGLTALAAQTFSALLTLSPKDVVGRMHLAKLLLLQNDLENALRELLEVTRLDPENLEAYQYLAEIYWKQGKGIKASEALRAVLHIAPEQKDAYYALGAFLQEQDAPASAERLYRSAVQYAPDDHMLWKLLGDVRARVEDQKGAISSYEKAIALKPDNTQVLVALAKLYLEQKEYAKAEALFSSAISLGARQASVYGDLGLTRIQNRDLLGAISILQEGLQASPEHYLLLYNLGVAMLGVNRCAQAKIVFEKTILSNPSFAAAHYNLGVATLLCADGQTAKEARLLARLSFFKAARLDPSLAETHYNLALLLEQDGDYEDAAKAFGDYLIAFPSAEDRDEIASRIRKLQEK